MFLMFYLVNMILVKLISATSIYFTDFLFVIRKQLVHFVLIFEPSDEMSVHFSLESPKKNSRTGFVQASIDLIFYLLPWKVQLVLKSS
jgi:hypothetical protein